jgi:hypothetical protein
MANYCRAVTKSPRGTLGFFQSPDEKNPLAVSGLCQLASIGTNTAIIADFGQFRDIVDWFALEYHCRIDEPLGLVM